MHESRWRVLHVVMNHEKRVAQHLTARSLEPYLPLYSERSRWSDRVVRLERPLFPGYVFVRFSSDARLTVISAPGVVRLLGEAERDTLSDAEIRRIRDGLASGCILRPHLGVAPGSRVRVLSGVFEGWEGVVTDLRKQCKVVMALSATGQRFSLELDLEAIEIIRSPVFRNTGNHERHLALGSV